MLSLLKQKETLPPFEGERGRKLAAWARWMFSLLSRDLIERHRQVSAVREDLGAAAENRTVGHLSGCVSATHRPWMDEMSSLFERFV